MVACRVCKNVYVTRIGARGCACSRPIFELKHAQIGFLDELDSYARAITDLRPAVAKAAPYFCADSRFVPCDDRWLNRTDSLVEAGVAQVVKRGDRVMSIDTGALGVIVGETDDNTELLVEWDGRGRTNACAGKRETVWELAVVGGVDV